MDNKRYLSEKEIKMIGVFCLFAEIPISICNPKFLKVCYNKCEKCDGPLIHKDVYVDLNIFSKSDYGVDGTGFCEKCNIESGVHRITVLPFKIAPGILKNE